MLIGNYWESRTFNFEVLDSTDPGSRYVDSTNPGSRYIDYTDPGSLQLRTFFSSIHPSSWLFFLILPYPSLPKGQEGRRKGKEDGGRQTKEEEGRIKRNKEDEGRRRRNTNKEGRLRHHKELLRMTDLQLRSTRFYRPWVSLRRFYQPWVTIYRFYRPWVTRISDLHLH